MKFGKSILMMSAGIGAALAGTAWAQTPQEPRPQADSSALGEIVVTAEKRAESIQDVPVAVTAFTSASRELTGIDTAAQQLNFTPGVSFDRYRVNIRGVGADPVQVLVLGLDPGVSVYSDGFYVPQPSYLGSSTLATDRSEVLRGPQGTLYGRNSIGGAVNIISRRPEDELTFEVRNSINSLERFAGEARVAGPITNNLRGSLMATGYHQQEGSYENFQGGADEGDGKGWAWSLDGQLEFDIGDNFEGWVRYNKAGRELYDPRNFTTINPGVRTAYGTAALTADFLNLLAGSAGGPAIASPLRLNNASQLGIANVNATFGINPEHSNWGDPRTFDTNRPNLDELNDYDLIIADMTWHADAFDVRYLGGYNEYHVRNSADEDGTNNQDMLYPHQFVPGSALNPNFTGAFGVDPRAYGFDGNFLTPATDMYDPNQTGDAPAFTLIHNDRLRVQDAYFRANSHELNFSSTHEGPLQWLLGLYRYESVGARETPRYWVDEPFFVSMFGTSTFKYVDSFQHLEEESSAIYTQFDYDFSDTLHGTVGLRYTHDEKAGTEGQLIINWIPSFVATANPFVFAPEQVFWATCGAVACDDNGTPTSSGDPYAALDDRAVPRDAADKWDAMTGTAGLQWTPSEDTLVYGRYSRGYKAGGFNLGFFTDNPIADKETVDSIEIGWKQTFGPQFSLNSAIYFNQFHDFQTFQIQIPTGQTTPLLALINIPESEQYGLELEARYSPTDNFFLMGSYTYIHTEIVESGSPSFTDLSDPFLRQPGANASLVGNRLPQTPEHKAALNATYIWNLENSTFSLSGTANYRGSYYSTVYNTPLQEAEGGTTLDLRAVWRPSSDNVAVLFSATNVFDEDIETYRDPSVGAPLNNNPTTLYLAPPRIVSLEVQYRF